MRQTESVIAVKELKRGDKIFNTMAIRFLQGAAREAFSWVTVTEVTYHEKYSDQIDSPRVVIDTTAWTTVLHPEEAIRIRRWETETEEEATEIRKPLGGVLAAPCDYGSAMSHVLSYLEERNHPVVSIEEWELREGQWDDDEGVIPKDLVDDWGGRDVAMLLWIGEPGDKPPTKLEMLEAALTGGCVPTDT